MKASSHEMQFRNVLQQRFSPTFPVTSPATTTRRRRRREVTDSFHNLTKITYTTATVTQTLARPTTHNTVTEKEGMIMMA